MDAKKKKLAAELRQLADKLEAPPPAGAAAAQFDGHVIISILEGLAKILPVVIPLLKQTPKP